MHKQIKYYEVDFHSDGLLDTDVREVPSFQKKTKACGKEINNENLSTVFCARSLILAQKSFHQSQFSKNVGEILGSGNYWSQLHVKKQYNWMLLDISNYSWIL